jgi:hypothetical protein
VKEGDWVEKGTPLGLCGNSGYSGEPHIHLQLQASEIVGAYTLPFCFAAWREGDLVETSALPALGARIEPARVDETLAASFTLPVDTEIAWRRTRGNRVQTSTCIVRLAADGARTLEEGNSRVHFLIHEELLLCYSHEGSPRSLAAHFFLALARLPLVEGGKTEWKDALPAHLTVGPLRAALASFLAVFHRPFGFARAEYRRVSPGVIEGVIRGPLFAPALRTRAEISSEGMLESIQVGHDEWRRIF